MVGVAEIQSDLAALVGRDAWRVSRIHGSMFFLEIGEKRPSSHRRRDGTVRHFDQGEWRFMFGMAQWRFEKIDQVVIACEDDQKNIDRVFDEMVLGTIREVSISLVGLDLTIGFDTQTVFKTFSNSGLQQGWDQWTLYCPDDRYWAANGQNRLTTGNSSELHADFFE